MLICDDVDVDDKYKTWLPKIFIKASKMRGNMDDKKWVRKN